VQEKLRQDKNYNPPNLPSHPAYEPRNTCTFA
jgi:hypothetical protein